MGVVEDLDNAISGLFGQWNAYSTGLVTLIVLLVSYRIMAARDPDIHPLLLAKQASPSPVRQEGESPIYRSLAAPYSMPLNSGLHVKDEGASKWSRGRDGDLRDVWRQAAAGGKDGAKGRLLTVMGSQKVIEHKLEDVTRQINIIGKYIAEQGGIRVAIYLPNSIEMLSTIFACSFYSNLTTILVPFDVSEDELISMLRRSAADTVITAPGVFPFDSVVKAYPSLRQLIWVVDEGSSHMDWNEVPEGVGGSVNVATWQDIMQDTPIGVATELLPSDPNDVPNDIVTFWQTKKGQLEEMVRFSQANLVAGIAGQIAAVPVKEKFTPSDMFLPADALTNIHTLILTMAALYQNTSLALNSVASEAKDLELATQGIAPTIIVASPFTLKRTHQTSVDSLTSFLGKISHNMSTRTLTREGMLMPVNALSAFASSSRPSIGTPPGKLRLLYVAHRAGAEGTHISAKALSDLRIFTGARIVYALTAARVAGAVAQTAYFDYRVDESGSGHFGPPTSSVEVFLKDSGAHKTTDEKIEGEIYARGPCVAGGEADVGALGQIKSDNTLALI